MTPPLEFDADQLKPRFIAFADSDSMDLIHRFETLEEGARTECRIHHNDALTMWMRCLLRLERAVLSFSSSEIEEATRPSWHARTELTAVAFDSSKCALDAVAAGYYSVAFGLTRFLFETWTRTAWLRLDPEGSLPYFAVPTESPVDKMGVPKKRKYRIQSNSVAHAIQKLGAERDKTFLGIATTGITHMHAGAHPGGEARLHTWNDTDPDGPSRIFGPRYDRSTCIFALKWGLCANLLLLREVPTLVELPREWLRSVEEIEAAFSRWNERHDSEFLVGGNEPSE